LYILNLIIYIFLFSIFVLSVDTLKIHFPGVRGKLSDLCKPTQKKYNLPITIAIGRHMDSIIVDDSKTAFECIDYLKSNNIGIATFIPLDNIKYKSISEAARNIGGSFQLAIDVIQSEEFMKKALMYALGNTLICDKIEGNNIYINENKYFHIFLIYY
jgi:structural maintenance of chromosome 1